MQKRAVRGWVMAVVACVVAGCSGGVDVETPTPDTKPTPTPTPAADPADEARLHVQQIAEAARDAYAATGVLCKPMFCCGVPDTVADITISETGYRYGPTDFQYEPWPCLGWQPTTGTLSYTLGYKPITLAYAPPDSGDFVVEARGDIDRDGTISVFWIVGTVTADGVELSPLAEIEPAE